MGLLKNLVSFGLDLIPGVSNFKSLVEACRGVDSITGEPLKWWERALCIGGVIVPVAFKSLRYIKKFPKVAKGVIRGIRIEKGAEVAYQSYKAGKLSGQVFVESLLATARAIQNSVSDTADFIRYDDGLGATGLRIGIEVGSTVTAPFIDLTKNTGKNIIYGIGYALGKTNEEMDQSLEKFSDNFSTKYDQAIDKLAGWGFSGRFLGDIGSAFSQVINYYNISNLSQEGLERVQGLQNEAARRYNENRMKQEKSGHPDQYIDNPEKWREHNNERLKFNRALEKAKQKAMKDDLKKNKGKKNPHSIFPSFGEIFGNLIGYFKRLFGNFWWLMKNDIMNYWKNRFGNGDYGFHTCPYGCGRPIPNSFKGCTELLAVFPDYFK